MIAYNSQYLDNRDTQCEAAKALAKGIITGSEDHRIEEAYPSKLYTPNLFIRIGLFLLTIVIAAAGLGLTLLIWLDKGDNVISILLIVWGLAAYGSLEYFIRKRGMHQSGVDDALLWIATACIYYGLSFLGSVSHSFMDWVLLLLTAWGVVRYADKLMTLIAYGALIQLIFYRLILYAHEGVIPFVFMALSIITYIFSTRLSTKESMRHYRACLSLLRMAALLSFYLSCNYFIVQHLDPSSRDESTPIALGWLWWACTAIVPVGYITFGIQKKDTIPLWTGLALVAASVFTVRYYHHLLSAEAAMILAGTILITASYLLIRYLRTPRHGFTSAAPEDPHPLGNLPVEGLILAETFKSMPTHPSDQPPGFGGGSGGGAGAGGSY